MRTVTVVNPAKALDSIDTFHSGITTAEVLCVSEYGVDIKLCGQQTAYLVSRSLFRSIFGEEAE